MFDRLEQHRVGLGETFGDRQAGRGSESHVGAVDSVEHAIDEGHRDIDDGIAEWTLLHGLLGGFADRRDILPRHRAAHDFIDEQKTLAAAARLNLQLDVSELAMAAGLAFKPGVLENLAFDRLLERNFRRGRGDLKVVSCGEAFDGRIEVNLRLALS